MGKASIFDPLQFNPNDMAERAAKSSPANPYQSPFPDEFLDERIRGYEAAIESLEGVIVGLRDWIRLLEAEREMPGVGGFQMESADI